MLASPTGLKRKETELLPNFLADVFERLLGYVPPPANPYTLQRETHIQVDGKFADDKALNALVVERANAALPLIEPDAKAIVVLQLQGYTLDAGGVGMLVAQEDIKLFRL